MRSLLLLGIFSLSFSVFSQTEPDTLEIREDPDFEPYSPDNRDFPEIIEEHDSVMVHDFLPIQPEFPGGIDSLIAHIQRELVYPPEARDMNVQGTVYIQFIVWKDGSIRKPVILRGVKPLNKEALRVVKEMPNWTPGKMSENGEPLNCRYTIPIKFQLN